ncbi:MAG: DedA family protein [Patescibacteria group bacterium]
MISNIIGFLGEFIMHGISAMGYWGVGLMMAIESACVPLPSEIIMPFSGFLVSKGEFTLWGVTIAGSVGSLMGSLLAYYVGVFGGRSFIEKYGKYILITKHDLNIADNFFNKYGASAVFFSRMLPVVRTFISLPAGIAKMNVWKLSAYTFAGSIPWCYFLAYVGKRLGDNWEIVGTYFRKFDYAIAILFIICVIWFVKRHLNIRKKEN